MLGAMKTLDEVDVSAIAPLLEPGPLVRIFCNEAGRPRGASSLQLVRAPADALWQVVRDPTAFPSFVRMVDSVQRLKADADGEELLRVNLRFKITLFAAKFHFVARVHRVEHQLVELGYVSGKVRDVNIRFEIAPAGDRLALLLCFIGFDQTSLGWLVKLFINHHPEIDWGVHAGSVMSVSASVRAAAEALER